MTNKIILFLKSLTEKQILLFLIGIAFGLRLYAVLTAKGIAYDSANYGFMARDFLKGNFIKGLSLAFHPFIYFTVLLLEGLHSHPVKLENGFTRRISTSQAHVIRIRIG